METKSVFQSKVFWFNLITSVLFLAESVDLVSVLPATLAAYLPIVIAVGNIALRLITGQPVSLVRARR